MAVLLEGSRPAMVGQCQRGSTRLPGLPRTPSLLWATLMETEMMQEVKAMPLLYVFCLFLKQQFVFNQTSDMECSIPYHQCVRAVYCH
jgi:hypothetical protein